MQLVTKMTRSEPNRTYVIRATNGGSLQYIRGFGLCHLSDADQFDSEAKAAAHARAVLKRSQSWSEELRERLGVFEIVETRLVTGNVVNVLERVY